MNNYEKEITELKKKIAEYEAVEQYIMETIRNGGEYDDILKAHYREGKVVDGEWVDDKEEEEEEEEEDKQKKREVKNLDEFYEIVSKGHQDIVKKTKMPDDLKSWAIDNLQKFNTFSHEKCQMIHGEILKKIKEYGFNEDDDDSEEEEEDKPIDIAFYCEGCDTPIIRDSEEHDNSKCDDEGKKWYCEDCEVPEEEEDESEEEEEEEEEKDDGSNTCYGVETRTQKTFIMSGGHGDWFNYVVVFDDDGEQKAVYIETKNGLELCKDERLVMTYNKHGDERIKCVYNHYELNEDKEECWITNC